ncbi:glycoside hydrolase family 9 protein [Fibrobacter sp. UWB7]|uniref:glycoside hydrolase family 9 protein n=1 Tax=Fibrobacter sp. UWB7 TaxID=1896206 RepID=UPI000922ACA4|nr:glycoside hydrolase family 9 protein [Fibrobacter sp. UWB7]SHM12307.1 Por secretion system C-terminal sorting domain-containing protein [Fibrobacter sp. UWB7]
MHIYKLSPIFSAAFFLSAGAASAETKFFYNQVGYDVGQPISVIVKSDNLSDGAEFSVMSGGSAVKTGKLSAGTNPDNWLSNGKFYVADLSGLTAGKYTLQVSENGQPQKSGEFTVGENALASNTLASVLNYFYDDRADDPTVEGWDKSMGVYNSSKKVDVHGGWYDASGDVSKYLSHLSYANYLNPQQIPLTVWSLAFASERIPKLLSSTATKAKTADEAAYGADFLVRMLAEEGFFYMTVFDNWGSPLGKREICAFSGSDGIKSADYQTAFREGGGMAIAGLASAARLKLKGDFTSEQYLAAAEKAYKHLSEKQSIGGNCTYCDDHKENIIDDYTALLAATELYAATKDSVYLKDARKRAIHLEGRLSEDGYFWSDDAKTRPFWHASDAGLPLIALIRYAEIEATTEESVDEVVDGSPVWVCPLCMGCSCNNQLLVGARQTIEKHSKWLISVTNKVDNPFGYARQTYKTQDKIKDGFFIPHDNESNYWWQGEDARIASLAAASMFAARALNESVADSVQKYATDQLDWILGKNPYATCMMYGKGTKNPKKYDGQSDYDATLEGGIANGITGKNQDGSGIAWTDDGVAAVGFDSMKESWQVWRWDEQWLPHSTWYLMAIVERYDEVSKKVEPPRSALPKSVAAAKFGMSLVGNTLSLNLPRSVVGKSINILDVQGNVQMQKTAQSMNESLNVNTLKSGLYLVQVQGFSAKKFVVK